MTKIYLITGFLGSGKSTYLNNLLMNNDKKTGVLINEFGKISIDTITLTNDGIDLLELTNGSIFCACLKDKFVDGLIELVKMDLDEIYIESSGLSDPSNMGSVLETITKKLPDKEFQFAGVICLVDALYFLKQIDVMESVRRQIKHSHLILINKIDLVDTECLKEIEEVIVQINPNAQIECGSYGKLDCNLENIIQFRVSPEESTNTESTRPNSMILEFNEIESIDLVKEFFEECGDYLFRAKGYLLSDNNMYKVDVVNDSVVVEMINKDLKIKQDEINKIVLLASQGLKSVMHISKTASEMFSGSVNIRS